jgi:hypothetical protein
LQQVCKSTADLGKNADGYSVPFSMIFDERAPISEWFSLCADDLRSRLTAVISEWKCFGQRENRVNDSELRRIPAGIGYFMRSALVDRVGSNKMRTALVLSADAEQLRDDLLTAVGLAKQQFQMLVGWKKESALASQSILTDYRLPGNPIKLADLARHSNWTYIEHQGFSEAFRASCNSRDVAAAKQLPDGAALDLVVSSVEPRPRAARLHREGLDYGFERADYVRAQDGHV